MTPAAPRPAVSLRISVTDRCPLACVYCKPPEGVPLRARSAILSFEEIVRFVRAVGFAFRVSKVHLTGGEPLVRRDLSTLVRRLAELGVADLALSTNGQLLADCAHDLRSAGLARVNISLDSLVPSTFTALARGGDLARTLAGIDAALAAGLAPVKLNTVVLRGCNDGELAQLAGLALERGCSIRFLELMPLGCAAAFFAERFISAAEIKSRLACSFDLAPCERRCGETSEDFVATDGRGRRGLVGFIAPQSRPFCSDCTRLRLTSTGRLIRCLAEGQGPQLRSLLRSDDPRAVRALVAVVARQLAAKRERSAYVTRRPMVAVGG